MCIRDSLILMGLRQQCQPTQASGLHHREVEIRGLGVGNALAFLLHEKAQSEVVKLGHGTHPVAPTLAVEDGLPTPPDVASTTDVGAPDGAGGTRTHDLRFRKPLLYPAELQPPICLDYAREA